MLQKKWQSNIKNCHLNSGMPLVIKKYYHGFYHKDEINDLNFSQIIIKKPYTPNSISICIQCKNLGRTVITFFFLNIIMTERGEKKKPKPTLPLYQFFLETYQQSLRNRSWKRENNCKLDTNISESISNPMWSSSGNSDSNRANANKNLDW